MKRKHIFNFLKLCYILIITSALNVLRLVACPHDIEERVLVLMTIEQMCESIFASSFILTLCVIGFYVYYRRKEGK